MEQFEQTFYKDGYVKSMMMLDIAGITKLGAAQLKYLFKFGPFIPSYYYFALVAEQREELNNNKRKQFMELLSNVELCKDAIKSKQFRQFIDHELIEVISASGRHMPSEWLINYTYPYKLKNEIVNSNDDVKQIFNYELNNIRFVLGVFDLIYQLYDVKFNVYCRTRAVSALIPALSKDRNVIHTRQFNIRFVGDNAISLHQFRNRECYTLVDEQYLKWMKAETFAPYLPHFNFAPYKFR